jgi:hypothetical protein
MLPVDDGVNSYDGIEIGVPASGYGIAPAFAAFPKHALLTTAKAAKVRLVLVIA